MNENLEQELRALIAKVIKKPEISITRDTDFFKDLKVDSLLAVEILASIDRKYGIDIPETKIKNIKNLADLSQTVSDLLAKKG